MSEKLITRASKGIKFAIPSVVLISIIFELFYFKGLGVPLINLPLAPTDFLKSWMVWFPFLIVWYFLWMPIARFPFFEAHSRLISKLGQLAIIQFFLKIIDMLPLFAWTLIFSIPLVAMPLLWGAIFTLQIYITFNFCSYLFYKWILMAKPQANKKDMLFLLFASQILSTIIIFAFTIGLTTRLGKFPALTQYSLYFGKENKPVIRIFDQWTLIKNSETEFIWVNNQSDKTFHFQVKQEVFEGYACSISEIICIHPRS